MMGGDSNCRWACKIVVICDMVGRARRRVRACSLICLLRFLEMNRLTSPGGFLIETKTHKMSTGDSTRLLWYEFWALMSFI